MEGLGIFHLLLIKFQVLSRFPLQPLLIITIQTTLYPMQAIYTLLRGSIKVVIRHQLNPHKCKQLLITTLGSTITLLPLIITHLNITLLHIYKEDTIHLALLNYNSLIFLAPVLIKPQKQAQLKVLNKRLAMLVSLIQVALVPLVVQQVD